MPLSDRAAIRGSADEVVWAEAQRLYEQTRTPAQDIATMLGRDNTRALYRIAERRGWKRQIRERGRPGTHEVSAKTSDRRDLVSGVKGRRQLIQKLEKTVGREIAAIDARLRKFASADADGVHGIDHERHARALATLARTLRELAAIERAELQTLDAQLSEDDDDDFPRDADTLRNTLAQRLEQLSQERESRAFSDDL